MSMTSAMRVQGWKISSSSSRRHLSCQVLGPIGGMNVSKVADASGSGSLSMPPRLCGITSAGWKKTMTSVVVMASGFKNTICAATKVSSLAESESIPVKNADGMMAQFPTTSGVYAVYDSAGTLQYIGISRKIAISMSTHMEALPELVGSVKIGQLPDASKEELTEAWKGWIQEAVSESGQIPPGNAPGEKKWQQRRARAAKPEIRLTPGKGVEDLTCSIEQLIDQVVKSCEVVAFVKGTRTEPQCGFSYKVLTLLQETAGHDFEVVNVLDEVYNPGLREAIKVYSQWPTIPQVYVGGEFIGGADIIEQMHGTGELHSVIQDIKNKA